MLVPGYVDHLPQVGLGLDQFYGPPQFDVYKNDSFSFIYVYDKDE